MTWRRSPSPSDWGWRADGSGQPSPRIRASRNSLDGSRQGRLAAPRPHRGGHRRRRRGGRARPRLRPRALGGKRATRDSHRRPGAGRRGRRQGSSDPRCTGRGRSGPARRRHHLVEPDRVGEPARGPLAGAAASSAPAEPVHAIAHPLRTRRPGSRPCPRRTGGGADRRRIAVHGDWCRDLAPEGRARARPTECSPVAFERDARIEHEQRVAVLRRRVHGQRPVQPERRCTVIERINPRLALLLAILLVLVVVLVGWFTILSPERSKAAELNGQIYDANVSLASTQALLDDPAAHRSIAQVAQLRRALPPDVEMSEIVRQLTWAAGRTGVRVDSITPSGQVPAAGAQAVPITLQVTGRYFRVANFMHLLRTRAKVENGVVRVKGRLYAIDNISLGKSATGGLVTATLALDAFTSGAAPPGSTTTGAQPPTSTTTTTTP